MALGDWQNDCGPDRHSDYNLRCMCREGIARVKAGEYDGLKFNVFNRREFDIVDEFMRQNASDIPPYTIDRIC